MTHRRHGLSLVEMMAVTALIALVGAIGTVPLAAAGDAARMRAFIADLHRIDAHARHLARTTAPGNGPVVMTIQLDVTVRVDQETTIRSGVPEDMTAHLRVDNATVESISWDRRGCGPDYTVAIHRDGLPASHVHVYGLTGWMIVEEMAR